MNKYNSEEYFSILDKKTGRKLLDCGDELDALSMVAMDPQNRTYTRNQFLMGSVVDIEMPKQLPTTDIVTTPKEPNKQLRQHQIKLPESEWEKVSV